MLIPLLSRYVWVVSLSVTIFSIHTNAADALSATSFDGYVLVTPLKSKETVLINNEKKEVHLWQSDYEAAGGARLLGDGSILRIAAEEKLGKPFQSFGVRGGRVQRIGWNGELLWDFWNAATYHMACGDVIELPSGNILMSVIEYKSQEDCLKLGRDPERVTSRGLYAPGLMEFAPYGPKGAKLAWKWSAWDHMTQRRNANLPNYEPDSKNSRQLDINSAIQKDGLLCTELSYDDTSGLIMLTFPSLGQIWLLDHQTTLQEAASDKGGKYEHGGSILWCHGNNGISQSGTSQHVVSAEFLPTSEKASLSMLTLALKGASTSNLTITIGKTSLTDFKDFLNAKTSILQQSEENLSHSLSVPNALTIETEGSWLMTRKERGTTTLWREAESGQSNWEYVNQRGEVEVKARDRQASAEELQTVKAALIGKPRYYSSDYLPSDFLSKKQPAVRPESSPAPQ